MSFIDLIADDIQPELKDIKEDQENLTHLGDGLYIRFNGYAFELMVNDHRNPVVAVFEKEHVQNFMNYVHLKQPKPGEK